MLSNFSLINWLTLILAGLFIVWTVYLLLAKFYKRSEFRFWLKRPSVQYTLKTIKQLYHNIDTISIARQAWQQHQFRDYAFIYGEIEIISFIAILEAAQPSVGEIFYDLGSGSGKAVFTAALAFDFATCKGVELVPELYQLSKHLQQQLPVLANRIIWLNCDFLTVDLADADIVFINAACFMGDTWQAIKIKLKQLKPGARLILASKELHDSAFSLIEEQLRYMSWGVARVCIYKKRLN